MPSAHEQYVVDAKGNKAGVILSLKRHLQVLEDLHDLAVVAERREERPLSLDEVTIYYVRHRKDVYRDL
jgi:hypothetical protein